MGREVPAPSHRWNPLLRTCIMYLIAISCYLVSLSVVRQHLYSKMFNWVKFKKKKKMGLDSLLKATVAAQIALFSHFQPSWQSLAIFFQHASNSYSKIEDISSFLSENKLAFGQTRFPAAADPIEHISEENFLLQIFAKMETFYDLTSPN